MNTTSADVLVGVAGSEGAADRGAGEGHGLGEDGAEEAGSTLFRNEIAAWDWIMTDIGSSFGFRSRLPRSMKGGCLEPGWKTFRPP